MIPRFLAKERMELLFSERRKNTGGDSELEHQKLSLSTYYTLQVEMQTTEYGSMSSAGRSKLRI